MRKFKIFFAMRILYNLFRLFPLRKESILFEASQGRFTSNPKYIYLSLIDDPLFKNYKLFWALLDPKFNLERVNNIKIYSIKYIYLLATANILINDNMWHPYMRKRKGQLFIQTWHGTPLKMIARDTNNPTSNPQVTKQQNLYVTSNVKLFDYVTSSSSYTTDKFRKAFGYNGLIAEHGTPRVDFLINNKEHFKRTEYLDYDKVVLVAPSFRKVLKGADQYTFFFENFHIAELAKIFPNYAFLIKMHNYGYMHNHGAQDNIFDASGYEDITHLYLLADTLLTDYSSSMFDFSVLFKTTILYPFDYDRNTQLITTDNEQLYLNLNEDNIPFECAFSFGQLVTLLEESNPCGPNRFTEHEKGASISHILDFIINNT